MHIKKPVKSGSRDINPDDILVIKRGLNTLGYYETPSYGITEYPDEDLFRSIKKYQKDKNLKVDGVINPDGETIRQLRKDSRGITVKSPTQWCTNCGAPHGGSKGDLCPDCDAKS